MTIDQKQDKGDIDLAIDLLSEGAMRRTRGMKYYGGLRRRSDELLRHYEITQGHRFSSLFVLGSHETIRVTLSSQQIRAIKLIDAIWGRQEAEAFEAAKKAGKLKQNGFAGESESLKDQKILVVGGGAGGLTAAAFAAQHGAKVMVVDRAPKLLSRFRASSRLLHPRLYEWGSPQDFSVVDRNYIYSPEADLPVLDWTAGPARAVARDLEQQWEGWAAAYGVQVKCGVSAHSHKDHISFHRCSEPSNCTDEQGCADDVARFASDDATC